MKKWLIALTFIAASSAAFADEPRTGGIAQTQLVSIDQHLTELVQLAAKQAGAAPDDTKFCYIDGKAFSQGWTKGDMRCEQQDGIRITGETSSPAPRLVWTSVKGK